jgi:hypothetical protein
LISGYRVRKNSARPRVTTEGERCHVFSD